MIKRTCILILILLFINSVYGLEIGQGKTSFNVNWTISYDSNLLRYSERDQNRFFNRTEKYPSPIATLDDIRFDWKFSIEYRVKSFYNKTLRLRGTLNFANHYNVPLKNLGWISLGARQDLSRKFICSFNYFYEPRFYIRDYTDAHTNTRQHCEFALNQGSFQITYRPKWLWEMSGICKIKDYQYNRYFTEYNGRLWELGLETVYRPNNWRFSFEIDYGLFNNTGYAKTIDLYKEMLVKIVN